MIFEEAHRLKALPPYLFAEIDRIIKEKKSKGTDVISLGIGDPDIPTANEIIDELCMYAKDSITHRYPSSYGLTMFKEAAANYYKDRFNVELDPETEIITLWGSKEGISNIAYAFIDPGDIALVPDPGYLVYNIGTMFAGGKSYIMPCIEENGFLPDLDNIDKNIAQKAKIMHINYPNNPTSATCGLDFFNKVSDFALQNSILVCHDNAYCDVYFDENEKPSSFLAARGARDVGIEFNSLSKTFNMTGWRIGFAAGNRQVIASLGKYKTNVDSGVFDAVQFAGVEALNNYKRLSGINIEIYRKRKQMVTALFDKLGFKYYKSNSTIYIWANVPEGYTSKSFAEHLLDKANVVVTPGSAFGTYGEGYYRISITLPDARLEEALERIQKIL
ncbi:MAG: LL-diaminopimelate aminotransferase [Actinobacteria bacterium]|nr:LL-diaminopimelate aminotransferase [Actinomycetota bacterium]